MNFVKLGGLVSVLTGKLDANAASPDGQYPFFTCAREPLRISSWSYDMDAVLVAGNGDLNVKYYNGKFDAYQRTYILSPKDGCNLDARYLYHFMEKYLDKLRSQSIGGIIKYIKLGMITEAVIPLPPLSEQKRIAAILDKADQLRQKRKQAIALLDSLTQSIFLEMFGDPVSNPKGWPIQKLSNFERFLTSGSRGWAAFYSDHGRPFFRIQNLKNGRLSTDDVVFVNPPDNAEARRTTVGAGDVLISITADLGRVAVVPSNLDGGANINQHIALFRPEGINSTYLATFLASEGGKRQFSSLNRQGVKAGLNFSDIRGLKIVTPHIALQMKFEQLVTVLKEKQVQYLISQEANETLFASLQHRAFSGQL